MGDAYTEIFKVITDKKPRFNRFYHHKLHSKISVSVLKYGDHNIMSTFQSLSTWLNFNTFYTHREANIAFLKYVITDLTLQYIAIKKTISTFMNIDLTKEDITTLQQNIENNINTKNLNKLNLDGKMKDAADGNKYIVFPAFDLPTKIIELGNSSRRVATVAYEINVILIISPC